MTKQTTIDPTNPFQNIPGLLETDEFPQILDLVGDDVHGIELRWDLHNKLKAEVVIKHELYEESFNLIYSFDNNEHTMTAHHPLSEHRKIIYKEFSEITPTSIILWSSDAMGNELVGKSVDNSWNEHPDSYVDDED